NKSDYVPEAYKSEIERLVMKVGFRLVLRKISFEKEVSAGSKPVITMDWENLGIAPPYRDHRVAFRLRNNQAAIHAEYISDQSIRGWLPGSTSVEIGFPIPKDLAEGEYTLELGLVFHSASDRIVPIANEGKTDDGWYKVGSFELE
ncbi:MAG: hypothetical protein DRI73_06265, partial [Bacteroidetes bacterium]